MEGVEGFSLDLGTVPRQLITFYGHFLELYSKFKQAIRALSTKKGQPSAPEFIARDLTNMRVAQFLATITSDSKKFQPRNGGVVK